MSRFEVFKIRTILIKNNVFIVQPEIKEAATIFSSLAICCIHLILISLIYRVTELCVQSSPNKTCFSLLQSETTHILPHLWSWTLSGDRNNKVMGTRRWKRLFPNGGDSLRHSGHTQSRASTAEVIGIWPGCFLYTSQVRCFNMSNREETPGQTHDTLERLCFLACLGIPLYPRGRARGSGWGKGGLSISSVCTFWTEESGTKQNKKKRKKSL